MRCWRFPLVAAVGLIALAAGPARTAPVRGERNGLEQLPSNSAVVIHLRGVQGVRDRLVTMMENALPDVLAQFQPQMDAALKDGFQGRKLRGLTKDGPIFFVIPELPNPNNPGPPKMAILVAVSNYNDFCDNILTDEERKTLTKPDGDGVQSATVQSETLYFVNRKTFAVVTPNEDVAKSFTKPQDGLGERISKEQAAKLLASDWGVWVNLDAVNKEYGEQIKTAKEGIKQMIAPLAAAGDEQQKKAMEMFEKAIDPVFQAVEDSKGVLLTVEFRPTGLALHVQSELRRGTSTAKLLEDSRPIAFKELEKLPQGRAYYIGMRASSALYKNLGSLIAGLPSADAEGAAKLIEELAKAGPSTNLSGLSFPMAGINVYHYDDPAKATAAMLRMYQNMDPKAANLKAKPAVKKDAQTYGDMKLHMVELAWDFDKMAEPLAGQGEEAKKRYIDSMKAFLGEKSRFWFGNDDKALIQVSAADWESARKLLDQYSKGEGGVGGVESFRAVRKELPSQTSVVGLIDAVQLFGSIAEAFKPMLGGKIPAGWPKMPGKDTAAYVGLAVTLQPDRGSFDLFISADAARETYKAFVRPLMQQ